MIRGIKNQCDLFKMFLQTQMFPWKRTNLKTKKEEITLVAGALRECPLGIYEYVFPKECLNEVMTMLDLKHCDILNLGKLRGWTLRMALGKGVKPIPDYEEVPNNWIKVGEVILHTRRYVEKKCVAIYPIGYKADLEGKMKDNLNGMDYIQEML